MYFLINEHHGFGIFHNINYFVQDIVIIYKYIGIGVYIYFLTDLHNKLIPKTILMF